MVSIRKQKPTRKRFLVLLRYSRSASGTAAFGEDGVNLRREAIVRASLLLPKLLPRHAFLGFGFAPASCLHGWAEGALSWHYFDHCF